MFWNAKNIEDFFEPQGCNEKKQIQNLAPERVGINYQNSCIAGLRNGITAKICKKKLNMPLGEHIWDDMRNVHDKFHEFIMHRKVDMNFSLFFIL
jgi:hypothetical protein